MRNFLSILWIEDKAIWKLKYFELTGNENTTHQNLQGIAKAVLRGKFRALNLYSRRGED